MKSQKGFSAVVVLLALLLVAFISFAGYYVYSQQSKITETEQATVETKKAETPQKTNPATATDTQKYLVIKEWGVKVPLIGQIEDAYYVYKTHEDGSSSVYLSTKSIDVKYPECAADKISLFAFGRFNNPATEYFDKTLGDAYPNAPKIGQYYYYGVPANQAACGNGTQASWDAAAEASKPIKASFAEAINKVQAE